MLMLRRTPLFLFSPLVRMQRVRKISLRALDLSLSLASNFSLRDELVHFSGG
jgi:hypothetical protein